MQPRRALILLVMLGVSFAATAPAASGPGLAGTSAPPLAVSSFPLGVFEDGNLTSARSFEAMLRNLKAHNLDAVMFTNNRVSRDAPLLAISDRLGVDVYMMPAWDLFRSWWPAEFPATMERAREVARPVVEQFGPHKSFKGYIVKDEPGRAESEKVALLTQALQELDPTRPAAPILIGLDRVGPIFAAARPDIMLIDVYPAGFHNPPCDFSMTGYGYPREDFVSYTRKVTRDKPPDTPLWMILQTHSFGTGAPGSLRAPSASEVRMQYWMALGEGATGIFWFIYSSQQGWTGLADSPLLDEVAVQARRTAPLRDLLLDLRKVEDRFIATGPGRTYVSTLVNPVTRQAYALVVNRDCRSAQPIVLRSPRLKGALEDVETGKLYALGAPLSLGPGDGRLLRLAERVAP